MYYNNRKLALSIFWVILGAVLMTLSVMEILEASVYSAMGGALMTVGILQIMRNIRYRKDPEYREKMDTELKDERNSFIRMKSWAWAGYIVVMLQAVGSVAAMILGQITVQRLLMFSVCLLVGAYWVSYLILSRKY